LNRMGIPALRNWLRISAFPALGARGSTRIRTGTPALCRLISLFANDVSCINQKATSMPTVSASINAQRGVRQSSNAVSQRRSCPRPFPGRRKRKVRIIPISEALSFTSAHYRTITQRKGPSCDQISLGFVEIITLRAYLTRGGDAITAGLRPC
jgi:hypothetical protein